MPDTNLIPPNSKYSHELLEIVCRFIREGNSRETSATLAGISPKTFYNWFDKYPKSLRAIEEAEEANKRSLSRLMLKHGKRAWQALAWYMERRYPQQFALNSALLVKGNNDGVQIAVIQGGYRPDMQLAREKGERTQLLKSEENVDNREK